MRQRNRGRSKGVRRARFRLRNYWDSCLLLSIKRGKSPWVEGGEEGMRERLGGRKEGKSWR